MIPFTARFTDSVEENHQYRAALAQLNNFSRDINLTGHSSMFVDGMITRELFFEVFSGRRMPEELKLFFKWLHKDRRED